MARVAKTKTENKTARPKKVVETATASVKAPKKARTAKEPVKETPKVSKATSIVATEKSSKKTSFVTSIRNLNSIAKPSLMKVASYRPNKKIIIALVIAAVLIIASYNKSWFIAATVNGKPITTFELMSRMNQQYRDQVLNQMVNEKILQNEADKNGVTVSRADLDNREKQMIQNVGGQQTFQSMLAQQGQTESSFRDQLKVWMTIEKLYSKDATVSADDTNKYIEQNKDQMQSTDSAKQKQEAEDALKQQKLGQIFNQKFQQLKQSAQVSIF